MTTTSKISEGDMVEAAARAMLEGRGELAEFLMREARQRREHAAGNVVRFEPKRPPRG